MPLAGLVVGLCCCVQLGPKLKGMHHGASGVGAASMDTFFSGNFGHDLHWTLKCKEKKDKTV